MNTKFNTFFLVFLILSFFQNSAFAQTSKDKWSGWRGLEKEGRSEFSSAPLKWSANENILWQTTIPGKGHSSPVISGNNVIVTTAYHTTKNKFFSDLISYFILGLVILILLFYLQFIYRFIIQKNKVSIQQIYTIWAFSITLGFVIYFSLTGIIFQIADNADHITQSTRWYFSGMVVSLCVMLLTYTISYSLKNRIAIIIFCLLFSFIILFLRPAPEYYTLTNDGSLANAMINSGLIPIVIALLIIVSVFLIKKSTIEQKNQTEKKQTIISKIILFFSISGAFIFGFYGIGIYRFLRYSQPEKDFSLPILDIYYRDSNVFSGIVFACLALWSAFFIINFFQEHFYKSRLFTFGILVLAILVFVKKNYFTIENEFVRAVICLDINSGKIKWTKEVFKGNQYNIHPDNSPASPTPIVIANRVYAYFGSPGLLCTDTLGNVIWQNTDIPFEDIHGIGASPMYCNGLIIILNDMPKAPYILAIDSHTGETVWTKKRKPWEGFHGSHRTPTIKKINGKDVIITWGYYGLNAYDLALGKELCSYPLENSIGQLVASIISKGDTIYAPDRDKFHAFSLSKLLQDKDSKIWTTNMNRKGPICSSPVLYKDMLFMISDNGIIHCMNAVTGKILWKEKLNGIYLASCTLIGENLYFSNTSGLTTIIAANKKFIKISENSLPEPVYASLAPDNNQIFIRTTEHLYCIKEK